MELSKVDPELRKPLRKTTVLPLEAAWAQRLAQALLGVAPAGKTAGVRLEIVKSPVSPLRVYHPKARRSAGALLWIHGGGYIIGRAVQSDRICGEVARTLGVTVVSVDYRLGAFPGPLDDCHAAWRWLQQAAPGLGIDPARVAVGGESAGGGLAACLVLRLRDEGGVQPCGQWLFSPMLDDRTAAHRELDAPAHLVWHNRLNALGWGAYLGHEPGQADPPAHAAAARRRELSGLPPAWIGVGDIDLFCAEDRLYAERLQKAGVPVTFEIAPGAPHGFEAWAPEAAVSRRHFKAAEAWLAGVLAA
ncbi:alpha/beta hydrolase [Phenylobacterium sp. LjRoot219]|uniref:alpha/beta hydrolase n=1 Tax=Phenylobacterium sp. LjRoot219 TaxID=3342283 RepID=UPI003ECF3056